METRILPCPVCGKRLIDANPLTKTLLYEKKEIPEKGTPDYLEKCSNCKCIIAIKKVA